MDKILTEKTPILYLTKSNNNEEEIHIQQQRSIFSYKKIGLLLSSFVILGCLGIATTFLVVSNSSSKNTNTKEILAAATAPISNNNNNNKIRLEDVLNYANKIGSPRPSQQELNLLDKNNGICYTQECLDAAYRLLHSMNFSLNPCQDFYEFSCGQWKVSNPIPENKSRWNQFNILRNNVNTITIDILTNPKNETGDPLPINQVKDFYNLCINTSKLESVGLTPLQNILKLYGDWPILTSGNEWNSSNFKWIQMIADIRRRFDLSTLFSVNVDQDLKNNTVNIIYIDQTTLILPRSMYLNATAFESIHSAYKNYVRELAIIFLQHNNAIAINETQIEQHATDILQFEIQLASITSKDEDRSSFDRMYNKYRLDEYQNSTELINNPGLEELDWRIYLNSIFSSSNVVILPTEPIIVQEPGYVQELLRLLSGTSSLVLANYLQLRLIHALGPETTENVRDAHFRFNQAQTGVIEQESRTQTCADLANDGLGMAVGLKYVQQVFDNDAKSMVNTMVEHLRFAFQTILNDTDWMDDDTKSAAQTKLSSIKTFMAYPDWLTTQPNKLEEYYFGLNINNQDHLTNVENLKFWKSNQLLRKLRLAVDKEFWATSPMVVNAFYTPTHNSITFPSGILQSPFFKSGVPGYLNFGGIGSVIGHEITHGFDNSGAQFDDAGELRNWWSSVTLDQFKNKTTCIKDQYSGYKPPNSSSPVNGQTTLGENIADNGGLREAFLAYTNYLENNPGSNGRLPGLEQYDQSQLFYIGYANLWCENITPEALEEQILNDPHSPAIFRVIGPLVNNVNFSVSWNCEEGSGMNPKPNDRCIVW